jgi:signal transduction histidine kinase
MDNQRRPILLQLAAIATAAIGLVVVQAVGGAAHNAAAVLAVASAASLGWCSLRSLDHDAAGRDAARRLKTELLSNVSHELRTPLNAILGYAEILESMPELPLPEREQMVTRILANAVTLTCAVNNLLEYSTVVAGEDEVRPATVHLTELFDELEPWVGRLIDEKPIAFAWDVDANVPPLETDRSKLRQVVLNLLANAAKFTPVGEIRLRATAAEDSGIEITVSDTGIGMSESDQTRIFEDFRQVAGSTTRPFGGIGLGLTLARRLCELLGGSMAVESTQARGTRVVLRLPVGRRLPLMEVARASS